MLDTLERYLPEEQVEMVMRAYEFGAAAHAGQTRKTGEPYISHPVAVAQELADMHLDSQAIAAAILHDVVEDTSATLANIEENFGAEVARWSTASASSTRSSFTAAPRRRRRAFAR